MKSVTSQESSDSAQKHLMLVKRDSGILYVWVAGLRNRSFVSWLVTEGESS